MYQQVICEDKLNNLSPNSSTDVHNVFVELSKILNNLETKYTILEEEFKTASNENVLLKLQNSQNSALLISNEIKLKETSKKLEEETANCNRQPLEENLKIAALNDEISNLKLKSSQLSLQNEELREKNDKLKLENSTLKVKRDECSDLIAKNQKLNSLNEEKESEHIKKNNDIKQLEEKLNRLSLELEREIAKNTALTEYNEQLDGLIRVFRAKNQVEKVTSESMESLVNSQEQLNDRNNGKVLIKDIPTDQILEPLENTVIVLASKMSMCINRDDIAKVCAMERKGLKEFSKNVSLLVEFKTSDTKTKFLSCRRKLKLNSSTKFIQLKEFVENDIYSLFLYANKSLREYGFKRVWYKEDQVFAKKYDNDTEIIEIKSRNHVDEIIRQINRVNWRHL